MKRNVWHSKKRIWQLTLVRSHYSTQQIHRVVKGGGIAVVQYRSGNVSCTGCRKNDCTHIRFLMDRGAFDTVRYVECVERRDALGCAQRRTPTPPGEFRSGNRGDRSTVKHGKLSEPPILRVPKKGRKDKRKKGSAFDFGV